jgi:SAM-dependent methyltransferase
MRQNKYDDPQFFERYSAMPRSAEGLKQAGEWYVLREMLPDFDGKRVLDLGCGFGWHCHYAREHGANQVTGVDLSERMLAHAREINADPAIDYRQMAIEDIDFAPGSFDVVISSLALHYIEPLALVFAKVADLLVTGGRLIFSVEHPVFTAREQQDWHYDHDGKILHWPLDDYQDEGVRHSTWMSDDIVKYHRTFSTLVNLLISAGLQIEKIAEPQPHPDMLKQRPDMQNESRRPMFLLIAASKP